MATITTKRLLKHEYQMAPVTMTLPPAIKKTGSLTYKLVDYKYAIPALRFREWEKESIKTFLETGWTHSYKGIDFDKEFERYFSYWDSLCKSTSESDINRISIMKEAIDNAKDCTYTL